jgi:hypothetical protein
MRARLFAALLVAAAVVPAAAADARTRYLRTFESCAGLVGYGQAHATKPPEQRQVPEGREGTVAQPTTAAPPQQAATGGDTAAEPDFSQTNVQEAGIDEPDTVKTDGRRLYAVGYDTVQVIDVRADEPRTIGSVDLPDDAYDHKLLLRGDKLLVISTGFEALGPQPTERGYYLPSVTTTTLSQVDVNDPAAPKVVRTQTVDGRFVDARLHGRTARVVTSAYPTALYSLPPEYPETWDTATGWRPRTTFTNLRRNITRTGPAVPCRAVRRPVGPVRYSGLGILTILTVDLDKGLPAVESDGIVTEGDTVYASEDNLYVATARWWSSRIAADDVTSRQATTIHRFDIRDPDSTVYRSSGTVRGYLLNQFSMSEHRGQLRVATTDLPEFLAGAVTESSSSVTVLDERDGALRRVGFVGGLGQGERIYAVRFLGDNGFIVTFRQTDPLYTLDLSDGANPRVLGELKIPGYSAYLHPIGDGLLIGVGQDATEQGRRLGGQISLFDVSDLRQPRRLATRSLGQYAFSPVEWDHHAFLHWPRTNLTLIPTGSDAVGFKVGRDGIEEVGRVEPDDADYFGSIERNVVVGGRVFSLSRSGAVVSGLQRLARLGWIPFPVPPDYGPGEPAPATAAQPASGP